MRANQIDLQETLDIIKAEQWALADIDWDAPGAEKISPKLRPNLKQFMSDLVWVEQVGARGFAALSTQAEDPVLIDIYRFFHAEEQRHANAQLALMRRWGMLEADEIPKPNINIRMVIHWLDNHAEKQPMSTLATAIPMLECGLDGALLKFLLDEVEDPICHDVFKLVNADESRHLAVGFHVLDSMGVGNFGRAMLELIGRNLSPGSIIMMISAVTLLPRVRNEVVEMGLDERLLTNAIKRYGAVGNRSENTRRNPMYRTTRNFGAIVANPTPIFSALANSLIAATEHIPAAIFGEDPSWLDELSYEPVH